MKVTNYYNPANLSIPTDSKIHVYNLNSPRTNKPVANQFVIHCGYHSTRFQSYETTCIILDNDYNVLTIFPEAFGYSRTTSKYSRVFLETETTLSPAEVEQVIKLAKTEDFGRDCPLCIDLDNDNEETYNPDEYRESYNDYISTAIY